MGGALALSSVVRGLLFLVVSLAFGLMAIHALQQTLRDSWLGFGVHPEVIELLELSMEDQRLSREMNPELADQFRERFEQLDNTRKNLSVLERSRSRLLFTYQLVLSFILAAALLLVTGVWIWRSRQIERGFAKLELSLEHLAAGFEPAAPSEVGGRGLLGRFSTMITEVSKRLSGQRSRVRALEHLEVWQEASRRHAHEVRTPLAAATLKLDRLEQLVQSNDLDIGTLREITAQLEVEVDELRLWADSAAALGKIPPATFSQLELSFFLQEWTKTYNGSWPELTLTLLVQDSNLFVEADRSMLRRVLVNLLDNAAAATNGQGTVTLTLYRIEQLAVIEVEDTGGGVEDSLVNTLFEPYSTSRRTSNDTATGSEGLGLGLPIARKIMLEHRGDLELDRTSSSGSTFRLTLPLESHGFDTDS